MSRHDRSLLAAAAVIHGRWLRLPNRIASEGERGGANEMSTTTPSPSLARSRRRRIECLPFSEMAEQRERENKCQHQMEQKRFGEELLRKRLILCLSVREMQRMHGRTAQRPFPKPSESDLLPLARSPAYFLRPSPIPTLVMRRGDPPTVRVRVLSVIPA